MAGPCFPKTLEAAGAQAGGLDCAALLLPVLAFTLPLLESPAERSGSTSCPRASCCSLPALSQRVLVGAPKGPLGSGLHVSSVEASSSDMPCPGVDPESLSDRHLQGLRLARVEIRFEHGPPPRFTLSAYRCRAEGPASLHSFPLLIPLWCLREDK